MISVPNGCPASNPSSRLGPGYGHTAGARIAEHPGIDKVSFTGSTATGRSVVQASAGNLKRVQLELGGKGANVVFDDANLVAAVNGSAFAIFHNQGQACIAGSRLLLHERIADEFIERFVALAASIRLGDPLDPATEMGPLTSPMHRDRVLAYVKVAEDQGGTVLTGGTAPTDPALANGCYVRPTVVRADPDDRVCQEEVFGPFVTVSTFSDERELMDIVNGTAYGLGGGLWTNDGAPDEVTFARVEAEMAQMTQGVDEVWLLLSEPEMWDARRLTDAWLNSHAVLAETAHFHGAQVRRYRFER